MNSETVVREQETEQETRTEPRLLEQIVSKIARDCRQAPDEYLDETTVPYGGE